MGSYDGLLLFCFFVCFLILIFVSLLFEVYNSSNLIKTDIALHIHGFVLFINMFISTYDVIYYVLHPLILCKWPCPL